MKNQAFFKLLEVEYNQWKIIGWEEHINYVRDQLFEFAPLIAFAEGKKLSESFRWSVEVGTVHFFLCVMPKSQTIKIGTKALHKELLIINTEGVVLSDEVKKHIDDLFASNLEATPSVIEYISFQESLPDFDEKEYDVVTEKTQHLMDEMGAEISKYKQTFLERVSDFALGLTANFALIRIHLLKYLAILPNLSHDTGGDEVKRLFLETLRRLESDSNMAKEKRLKGQRRPLPDFYIRCIRYMGKAAKYVPTKILAVLIRFSVSKMAKRFIAGEDINSAKGALNSISKTGRSATIDQLGELVVSRKEADDYLQNVLSIIEGLKNKGEPADYNKAGILKAHVSIKVSALTHNFTPEDFDNCYEQIAPRLTKILLAAKKSNVFINIDAEHYHFRNVILRVYFKVLESSEEFKDYAQTGVVVQAYLRDAKRHLDEILEFCKKRKVRMPIRLVKGAYWDAETVEAEAHNFKAPEFLNKEETDLHFRQLVFVILKNPNEVALAVASHNIQDHCFAEILRSEKFPDSPEIEHQCLHMTYEGLSMALVNMGFATRNYIPLGNLLVGMAYLVRRIMENSSQVGVLTIMRSHKKSLRVQSAMEKINQYVENGQYVYDKELAHLSSHFKNIYPIRTYTDRHLDIMTKELTDQKIALNKGALYIDEGDIVVNSPSYPELVLGKIKHDNKDEVSKKIEYLAQNFKSSLWKKDIGQRASAFIRLAELLLLQREKLSVMIMMEAGKTINEATADVDEAIDFINFYLLNFLKKDDLMHLRAKGVVGVISPWNFPIAIACGMTVAPLICGNSVILKPAEQTPIIVKYLVDLCYQAGVPKEVLQLSFGEAEAGAAIVDHELTCGIVFTGSKAVGTQIYEKLARQNISDFYEHESSFIPKFAITEMGGKNAIIVTNNCEMDETISGIIYSAFAHGGQKCSAASRIIIDNNIKDVFIERFREAVADVKVGRSDCFSTLINPLIAEEDEKRVKKMAAQATKEINKYGGEIVADLSRKDYPGYCVGPSAFMIGNTKKIDDYKMVKTEVFGPMVHIIGYDTLDEAIEIFNDTEYALTGGIFCQSQDDIEYLTPHLHAGNIYVNRSNTGARVGIEPFGGFKMSGTGPKAGSEGYLSPFYLKGVYEFYELKDENLNVSVKDFDLARASKRAIENRIHNAIFITQAVLKEKEVLFEKSDNQFVFELENLIEKLSNGLYDMEELEFANIAIPGQMSFAKRDIQRGNGILLDSHHEISLALFFDFIFNLVLGNGLNVITLSEESYSAWNDIINLAYANGVSIYNVNLCKANKKEVVEIIKSYELEFLILGKHVYDKDIIETYLSQEANDFLPRIIYESDSYDLSNRVELFSHERSFAINTMRHGAPLELNL